MILESTGKRNRPVILSGMPGTPFLNSGSTKALPVGFDIS
jgi:hypothetical protein